MNEGNLELVEILASWTVTLPAVAAIIVRDERRLTGEKLERAWPPQSRDAAIFGLWLMGIHPLCVVIHFGRTRRSVRGVLLGLVCLAAVALCALAAEFGATAAIEALGL